jgi:O-antigen/teichoic acid export membrane protein
MIAPARLSQAVRSARDRAQTQTARATFVSMVAGGFMQGTLLVSGILTARMLGKEDRGYFALLATIPSAISQLGAAGLSLAVTYYVARDGRAARAVAALIARPALVQVALLTIVHAAVMGWLVTHSLSGIRTAAVISLTVIPATFATEYGLAFLQGRQRYSTFNALRVLPVIAYSSVVVVLFVLDAGDLVLVTVASTGTACLAAIVTLRKGLAAAPRVEAPPPASVPSRREMLGFGFRSYLGTISPLESFRLDQLYIGAFLPPAELGLYVVGVAFTNLTRFIGQSVGMVASPHIAAQTDPDAQIRAVWRFLALSCAVCALVTLVLLASVGQLIPLLFGDEFRSAVPVSRILLISAFFLGVRRVVTDAARGFGMPALGVSAEIGSLVWFAATVPLLEPRMGLDGVAWAYTSAAAAGFAVLIISFLVGRRRRLV